MSPPSALLMPDRNSPRFRKRPMIGPWTWSLPNRVPGNFHESLFMNLLFLGDIVGKPGRDVVHAELAGLRDRLKLDFVIANGENAAGGFGITRAIAEEFFAIGIDVISTGNHWADQKEILTTIDSEDRIL